MAKTTATKAWFAGAIATVVAFLGALITAATDNVVTGQEWLVVALATVTALGGVAGGTYLAPANREKATEDPWEVEL